MAIKATNSSGNDYLKMESTDGAYTATDHVAGAGGTRFAMTGSFTVGPYALTRHRVFSCTTVLSGTSTAFTGSMQVSGSMDGTNFFGLNSGTATLMGNGAYYLNFDSQAVRFVKVLVSRTAGNTDVVGSIWLNVIN